MFATAIGVVYFLQVLNLVFIVRLDSEVNMVWANLVIYTVLI